MACYPWAVNWAYFKQDIEQFKHLGRWFQEVGSRPGVQRGMDVGKDLAAANANVPPEEAERRAQIRYNQRALSPPG
jgi:GST-like protein